MSELTRADLAKIDLWTAEDLTFVISKKKGIGIIPRFTACTKPVYTKKIKRYLERMEKKDMYRPPSNPKAVCVDLSGMLRYVWRTDVLTKEQCDAARKKQRSRTVGIFGEKSGRTMDKGDQG